MLLKDFILTVMNQNYPDCRCAQSTEILFFGPWSSFDRMSSLWSRFHFGFLVGSVIQDCDILFSVWSVTFEFPNLSWNDWTHLGTCGQQVEMSNVEWISIDTLWVTRKLSRLPRRINSLNKTGLELKDARIWTEYLLVI